MYKIFIHPNNTHIYYSGIIYVPHRLFLMRENFVTGNTMYIQYYEKDCNFNSHTFSTTHFYCLHLGAPNYYLLEIDLSNGIIQKAVSPAGYSWQNSYWDVTLSQDETKAFFSAHLNGQSTGAVCKWEVGTLNNIECLNLGTLYVPFVVTTIVSNKVLVEASEEVINKALYFVYFDLDTDTIIWDK